MLWFDFFKPPPHPPPHPRVFLHVFCFTFFLCFDFVVFSLRKTSPCNHEQKYAGTLRSHIGMEQWAVVFAGRGLATVGTSVLQGHGKVESSACKTQRGCFAVLKLATGLVSEANHLCK